MKKQKVFISSVQTEFARERGNLFDYLLSNPLLGFFFEPILFDKLPTTACLGTGTGDIIRLCNEAGLKEPEFIQEEDFKTIIWRTLKATGQAEDIDFEEGNEGTTPQATPQATLQADEEVSETVKRVVLVLEGDLKRAEIQELLELRDRANFVSNYLNPSLESAYIEMTIPEIPTHQEQRYRLTDKGIALKKKLQKSKKKK